MFGYTAIFLFNWRERASSVLIVQVAAGVNYILDKLSWIMCSLSMILASCFDGHVTWEVITKPIPFQTISPKEASINRSGSTFS